MKREPAMPADWATETRWDLPEFPEREKPAPLNLTREDRGAFTTDSSMSLRFCHHCGDAIHVGQPRVNHRGVITSHVTRHFHPDCVVLP